MTFTSHASGAPGQSAASSPPAGPAALAPDVKIRLRGLTKIFETRKGPFLALDSLSLDIPTGCFFMIVGPSGCGKTTLLRILAGLETHTSGTIEITPPTRQSALQRHDLSGRFPVSLDDSLGQRGLWPRHAPPAQGEIKERRRPLPEAHGPEQFRRSLSAPAFRRHAPARVDRARLRQRSRHSPDGRAVLRARRAEQALLQEELLRIWEETQRP